MPFSYYIDTSAGILFLIGEGVIDQADRIRTMRAWLSDPQFRPGLDTLCDFTAAASTPTMMELRELVTIMKQNAPAIGRARLAMATGKPITFGVARQFQSLASSEGVPIEIRLFTTRAEAFAWLRPD